MSKLIDLSKYSDGTLEFLLAEVCVDWPGDTLFQVVQQELERRHMGLAGTTYFEIPCFIGEDDLLHSMCHKLLCTCYACEKQELYGPRDFFQEIYNEFLGQIGFELVDVTHQSEQRVYH